MAGFFSRLFGTDKALEAVVDGVSNGLDKLVYTDEERAEAAAQDRSEARKMVVGWMAATQGQNLARRFIALMVTSVWLGQYLIAQALSMVAIFVDKSDKIESAAALMRAGAGDMDGAVMLILGFYFAAPQMGKIADAVIGNFASKAKQ